MARAASKAGTAILRPTSSASSRRRMYLNFRGLGEEGETLLERTFGANYPRVARIKKKYDPDNLFRFNQNIVPGD